MTLDELLAEPSKAEPPTAELQLRDRGESRRDRGEQLRDRSRRNVVNDGTEPPPSHARFILSLIALLAYGTLVTLALTWPTTIDTGYQASLQKVLDVLHRYGLPEWFGYNSLEFTANVFMFVPLGFLVAFIFPSKLWWVALPIAPAFSAAMELFQATFLPGRVPSARDVIANTIGAVIGTLIAMLIRAAVHRRDARIIEHALWEHRRA